MSINVEAILLERVKYLSNKLMEESNVYTQQKYHKMLMDTCQILASMGWEL